MLIEREYMKGESQERPRIVASQKPSRFSTYTPTQWANLIIFVLAALIIGFILSRIFS